MLPFYVSWVPMFSSVLGDFNSVLTVTKVTRYVMLERRRFVTLVQQNVISLCWVFGRVTKNFGRVPKIIV
jgi:hypothetical protein